MTTEKKFDNLELSEVPDAEAGRLFDEWWSSLPSGAALEAGDNGSIQAKFNEWMSARSTKN